MPRLSSAPMVSTNEPTCDRPLQRVLVVDDDVDLAMSLAMVLATWGLDVRTAWGGAAAIGLCDKFHPQLVISDICMPGMNGFDLARHLRHSHGRDMRLMALTGNTSPAFQAEANRAGFDEFRGKPLDLEELHQLIDPKSSH